MNYKKIFICTLLLIIYGYFYYLISIHPTSNIWGYFCAILFMIIFILVISIVNEYDKKKKSKDENNSEN